MAFWTRSHEDRWYCRKLPAGGGTKLSIGAASTNTGPLGAGLFRLIANVNCHLAQGGSAIAATTSDFYLPANQETFMNVDTISYTPGANNWNWPYPGAQNADAYVTDDRYIAGIRSASNGTLWITRVSEVGGVSDVD